MKKTSKRLAIRNDNTLETHISTSSSNGTHTIDRCDQSFSR